MSNYVSTSEIRAAFSSAMSEMYREEVPAYGTPMALVNDEALKRNPFRVFGCRLFRKGGAGNISLA
ncbi:DUF1338 family protein [Agrobacterium sp. B1(2019)]|uniref:DUF1338 family protein n=1 Tax=Agrobacterium sp. B1(2019) TaxID=2607032 RepID=UPI001FEF1517|nr:DUF1338 family protein [Agrobacterium sp. B1(2019)]